MSLNQRLLQLSNAVRAQPAAGIGDDLVHVPIFANAAGDNTIIPSPNRPILIMELFLWNAVGAQTWQIKDGAVQLLVQQANVPVSGGLMLGLTGNGAPHFKVSQGNSFVLNLSAGTEVDGYVKYKLA
jgi:hypothetical protein